MRARRRTSAEPPRRERGFALLLVLLLCTILFVIVAELAYQSSYEYLAARNVSDIGLIEYAIDGQLEVALGSLKQDRKQNEVDSEYDEWNSTDQRQRTDGKVELSQRIFDEQGKFNLSRLVTGTDPQKARARQILVRLIDRFRDGLPGGVDEGGDVDVGTAEDLVEKIVKDLNRESAQGKVPRAKTNPANVPLLLDAITFSDPKTLPKLLVDLQVRDQVAPGLHRFVTVYGSGKVNLNSAPKAVLESFFSQGNDRDFAQSILDRRRSTPEASGAGAGAGMSSTSASSSSSSGQGNPYADVNQLTDGSTQGLTLDVLQRNGIVPAEDFDVKSDVFGVRIRGSTERTSRDELFVVERVKTEGFRFLLHQERTDSLLETEEDSAAPGGSESTQS